MSYSYNKSLYCILFVGFLNYQQQRFLVFTFRLSTSHLIPRLYGNTDVIRSSKILTQSRANTCFSESRVHVCVPKCEKPVLVSVLFQSEKLRTLSLPLTHARACVYVCVCERATVSHPVVDRTNTPKLNTILYHPTTPPLLKQDLVHDTLSSIPSSHCDFDVELVFVDSESNRPSPATNHYRHRVPETKTDTGVS